MKPPLSRCATPPQEVANPTSSVSPVICINQICGKKLQECNGRSHLHSTMTEELTRVCLMGLVHGVSSRTPLLLPDNAEGDSSKRLTFSCVLDAAPHKCGAWMPRIFLARIALSWVSRL
ncbi:uncharacterized protein LJ206_004757 isoform 1-T1 [Theristicus caerulescens]